METTDEITLVLLPGMDGTGELFPPFTSALPSWIKPLVVRYPGSRALNYAEHLEIVMNSLPVKAPYVILGESFSGPLALMAAARRPDGLKGVILSATFTSWPMVWPRWLAKILIAAGVFRLKSTPLFERIVMGGADPELLLLFRKAMAAVAPDVLDARGLAVMEVDCLNELRDCPVPVLALVSNHDRIVSSRCSRMMQAIRPDLETEHFEAAHLILQLATCQAVATVSRFAAAVSEQQQ